MDETALDPINEPLPDAMEALLARVRGMPGRRKFRAGLLLSVMGVAFVAALVGLDSAGFLETVWPVPAAFALIVGSGICLWTLAEKREIRTIEALMACQDIRTLGGLLDAVNSSNRRVRRAIQDTLLGFLPRLTEEHSALLNTGHHEVLNALLYSNSSALAMEALSALEQVGNGIALPYLTAMAAGKGIPATLRDRQGEVQQRSRQAVEKIRERIERQNRASLLLRASQAPNTPAEQLVRPAQGGPFTKAEELLRPGASAESVSGQKEDNH